MIALTGFLAIVLIAMLLAPATDFARHCHRELVERPAARLRQFRSHHVLYALVLIPVMLAGGEFIAMLGPEFFTAYAMEIAIYLDAVIVTLALSAYAQIQAGASTLRAFLRRPLRQRARVRRKRRARLPQAKRGAANDDEDRPAFAVAA